MKTSYSNSTNRPATEGATALSDGRRERGRRTREMVIGALIGLIEEGELRPSAQRVASRAGVAMRTVYHHFSDIDALRVEAVALAWADRASSLEPVEVTRPLAERVSLVVRQLKRLFEAVGPICRAGSVVGNGDALGRGGNPLPIRHFIAASFEPELRSAGIAAPVLLDALDTALCWQNWEYMRSELRRSASKAAETVALIVHSLLTAERLP